MTHDSEIATIPASTPVDAPVDRDYVLGTHDREVARLGSQHDAWRPIALECWDRAGITAGSRVLDVGAGPGCAALDLATMVGPSGAVVALERSRRFVAAGRAAVDARGCTSVEYHEHDLMVDPIPEGLFDAVWCRWVCSFVVSPEVLIRKMAAAVRPGGVAVFHEYADYASWRFSPRLPLVEDHIARIMDTWRTAGGEPDVAMALPPLLSDAGFVVRDCIPHVFCVSPGDPLWDWISTFLGSSFERLEELGTGDADRIDAARQEFAAAESDPTTRMITPMVLEIIADRAPR